MATASGKDFVALGRAQWGDPDRMTARRVEHVPVHVFRHKATRRLHVILVEDERMNPAPTYIVKKNELILPAGGLKG